MEKFREKIRSTVIKLSKIYNNLFLEWGTGAGKTLASLEIVEDNPSLINWLIVCNRKVDQETWAEEIRKHGKEHLLFKIHTICYDSLHKVEGKVNLILDEAHHVTEKRLKYLSIIKGKRVIALSATMPEDKKVLLNKYLGGFHYHRVPIDLLIESGIIKEPKIYVKYLLLDDTETNRLYKYKKHIRKKGNLTFINYPYYKKYRNPDKRPLAVMCNQKEYLKLLNEDIKNYKNNFLHNPDKEWLYNMWMRKALDRKNFLASLKTDIATQIISKFIRKNERFICFGDLISQVETITKSIGKEESLIHSRIPDSVDKLKRFNKKELNSLFAVEMLKESANLNDIDSALLIQVSANTKNNVQVLGRVLRGELPKLYLLVIKDTKDEEYYNKFIENVNSKYIHEDGEIQLCNQ